MVRQAIESARKAKGWSRRRASKEAGLGETYIRDLMREPQAEPEFAAIMALADALDIPPPDLAAAARADRKRKAGPAIFQKAHRLIDAMSPEEAARVVQQHEKRAK